MNEAPKTVQSPEVWTKEIFELRSGFTFPEDSAFLLDPIWPLHKPLDWLRFYSKPGSEKEWREIVKAFEESGALNDPPKRKSYVPPAIRYPAPLYQQNPAPLTWARRSTPT